MELRRIARDRIAKGELPGVLRPLRTWGGHGSGQPCDLCGRTIRTDEMGYEVEYAGNSAQALRFHVICESIWTLEVVRADYLLAHAADS